MRLAVFLVLVSIRLSAQITAGSIILDFYSGVVSTSEYPNAASNVVLDLIKASYTIYENPDLSKSVVFVAYSCNTEYVPLFGQPKSYTEVTNCTRLSEDDAETLEPIDAGLKEFYSIAPKAIHNLPVYGGPIPGGPAPPKGFERAPSSDLVHPHLVTDQPTTPANPSLIMLDGGGNTIDQLDLTTFSLVSQVVVPSTSGPFGVRPVATGSPNEVWVADAGVQVSVVDLAGQVLVMNIPTPSVPQSAVPVGFAFTNDGTQVFEVVSFDSPDPSGNKGALIVFDAVNRAVTSTLLLKNAPSALVMAPDSSTAYLLSDSGELTYYDVLSGTADLTLSTFTPGQSGGYGGVTSRVSIHPDGTRLFWNTGTQLNVFDLITHKIVSRFSSGLPTTSPIGTAQLSQDGSTFWFSNQQGTVVILDSMNGNLIGTFTVNPNGTVLPAPAY